MSGPDKNTLQYKENSIASARPEDLTLMMYNGLLKFIAKAQDEIRAKSFESAHNTLIRCQDIVFEFQYTLNMDYTLSNNLMLLYDYLYNRLIEANAKKDCDILAEVQEFATDLRDTWAEAVKLNKEQKAAAAEAHASEQGGAEAAADAPDNAANASTGAAADAAAAQVAATETGAANNAATDATTSAANIATTDATTSAANNVASAAANNAATDIANDETSASASDAAPTPATMAGETAKPAATAGGTSAQNTATTGAPKVSSAKAIYKRIGMPVTAVKQTPKQNPLGENTNIPAISNQTTPPPMPGAAFNRVNPAVAAQYAKVSKAKNQPQEIISLASE